MDAVWRWRKRGAVLKRTDDSGRGSMPSSDFKNGDGAWGSCEAQVAGSSTGGNVGVVVVEFLKR